MKLYCKNSLFSLKVSIIISGDIITGIASGTAMCLKALPIPMPLQIKENERIIENKDKNIVFIKNLEKLSCLYICRFEPNESGFFPKQTLENNI